MQYLDDKSFLLLRLLLCGLIAAHGWTRLLNDGVQPFGLWLTSQQLPVGMVIAWGVTGFEIVGSLLLALGVRVLPLCLAFAAVYTAGIYLVHAPHGWFVVGPGRNGAEYSVLLICCLLLVGVRHYCRSYQQRQQLP